MVPWAQLSAHRKRHLDRFSHFVRLATLTTVVTQRQTDNTLFLYRVGITKSEVGVRVATTYD